MFKAIKLSKEQKEKLLEMALKLFPYDKAWFLEDSIVLAKVYKKNVVKPGPHYINRGCIKGISFSCHWFEFCYLKLAKAIFFKNFSEEAFDAYNIFTQNSVIKYMLPDKYNERTCLHPIDYLYEIFQENEK